MSHIPEITYVFYLVISIPLAVWVGRTLHRGGRAFLVEVMEGNVELADSLNRLLLVGFYLINLGYITLALKTRARPDTVLEAIELLSWKIGLVLVILGGVHFFNMWVLSRWRQDVHRRPRDLPEPLGSSDYPISSSSPS